MSSVVPRVRGSNKRIDPVPSLLLGLLQADFLSSLFYFVFCSDLLQYAHEGVYSALNDFLTIYGCFVAVTGVLWLGHTIYLHTNIPRNRRLRRVEGLASKLYPDHTQFEVMTKRFLHSGPRSWRAINATNSWCATLSAYDTSGALDSLVEAFVCDMTAEQALQELEHRLQELVYARHDLPVISMSPYTIEEAERPRNKGNGH